MKRKHFDKIKRLMIAGIPSANDLSIFIKSLVIVFVLLTVGVLFNSISNVKAADSVGKENDNVFSGFMNAIIDAPAGCPGVAGWSANSVKFSNASTTAAFGESGVRNCQTSFEALQGTASAAGGMASSTPRYVEVNYGATGSILNSEVAMYSTNIAMPGVSVEYYASQIKGTAYAADNPTSGRSVLAPIFYLNQAMVNLAYALVVIVLVFSGLNILISSLTGAEERFTLVQLLINAGITLIVITFYYEIAAIIFDLTVNYGNALVASIMSPFINSQVILDRLQPGGDLNIIAMINTFEFAGITDSLLVVTQSVASGLLPAITQSSIALNKALTANPVVYGTSLLSGDFLGAWGHSVGLAGGVSSVGISWMVSNFLGNKQIFDAIIAWAVFFVNIKVFVNLLSSFLTFCFMTAFGPMIVLGAITGGFEKISTSFKSLVALGAVFPLTFLMIMLGATSMNIFIKDGAGDTTTTQSGVENKSATSATVLCKYSSGDSRSMEAGIATRDAVSDTLSQLLNWAGGSWKATSDGRSAIVDDPAISRSRNFVNQRIYDVTPFTTNNNVRDCRPALFPTPFTFIPAPFGTIGNRALQIQTIDSLVRTFLGIVFLVLASRAPSILEEILEVKKLRALEGLIGAFKGGSESFFAVGGTALSLGLPVVSGITKWGSDKVTGVARSIPIGRAGSANDPNSRSGRLLGGIERLRTGYDRLPILGSIKDPAKKRNTLGDLFDKATTKSDEAQRSSVGAYYGKVRKQMEMGVGAGNVDENALQSVYGQNLVANFDKLSNKMNVFGSAIATATTGLAELTKQLSGAVNTMSKLVSLDILDQT